MEIVKITKKLFKNSSFLECPPSEALASPESRKSRESPESRKAPRKS